MSNGDDWQLPWEAQCLCGQVQMRITAAPLMAMTCHCKACQKLTSGPYSLTLALKRDGFAVVSGRTVLGGLKAENRHHFCPDCLSWLYTEVPDMPDMVNFRATMLTDASWVMPYIDTCLADRLPGVASGAVHAFEDEPPDEAVPGLLEAYAREGARPG